MTEKCRALGAFAASDIYAEREANVLARRASLACAGDGSGHPLLRHDAWGAGATHPRENPRQPRRLNGALCKRCRGPICGGIECVVGKGEEIEKLRSRRRRKRDEP